MALARPLGRPATLADLESLPEHLRGEIIDGMLYVFPRPRALHANMEAEVAEALRGPFQKGRGGPGGWWILPEPGIQLARAPEFVPDVAGWRRERLARLPEDAPLTTVPDWLCEILSPTTRRYDLIVKRRFYAEIGVGYLWYVDLDARALMVSRLENGHWVELGVYGAEEKVQAEPFEGVEIDLAAWWEVLEAQ
ncbi:Uma2 family endonuclease [Polyangium spumosum]|uniref:Uma2 family endonuclease n=1 Tax=Polyangium spumosum TaxID=889282 RepID=A0A6N7PS97_9BACT|nr:Uma2 family endonuclease [Polyangium spumosum]MRG92924.1 Uma2 family endonuclease [Polyangium spumosum]